MEVREWVALVCVALLFFIIIRGIVRAAGKCKSKYDRDYFKTNLEDGYKDKLMDLNEGAIQVGFRKHASVSAENTEPYWSTITKGVIPLGEGIEAQIKGAEHKTITYEKEMAEYIILTQGWVVKECGVGTSKIISADKTLITKQGVPTEELNKWIVDNYEPNGTLKLKTENI